MAFGIAGVCCKVHIGEGLDTDAAGMLMRIIYMPNLYTWLLMRT
jgi:hypothetical protein